MSSTFPEPFTLIEKLGHQRGPVFGRGPGRPWLGTAEATPQLWVTWFVDAARRMGQRLPTAIEIDGKRVPIVTATLRFGERPYFVCPSCGRRVEVLYLPRGRCGCRRCCRLGYRSQQRRPTSALALLDRVFAREVNRWELSEAAAGALVAELRAHLMGEIAAMLARVAIHEDTSE